MSAPDLPSSAIAAAVFVGPSAKRENASAIVSSCAGIDDDRNSARSMPRALSAAAAGLVADEVLARFNCSFSSCRAILSKSAPASLATLASD